MGAAIEKQSRNVMCRTFYPMGGRDLLPAWQQAEFAQSNFKVLANTFAVIEALIILYLTDWTSHYSIFNIKAA